MAKFVDLTGQKFGRLTVLEMVRRPKKKMGIKLFSGNANVAAPIKPLRT